MLIGPDVPLASLLRWAAKEAVYKALQPRWTPTWKEVSVVTLEGSPKPVLLFEPDGALGAHDLQAHLSVSHDGEYLVAGVIVKQKRPGGC